MIGRKKQRAAEVPAGRTNVLRNRGSGNYGLFLFAHFLKDCLKKKEEEEDVTETIGHLQSKLLTSELCFLWSFNRKRLLSPNLEHQGCLSKEKKSTLQRQYELAKRKYNSQQSFIRGNLKNILVKKSFLLEPGSCFRFGERQVHLKGVLL